MSDPQTTKKNRYKVWFSSPNSEDMPHGQASFTIKGMRSDTLYECESLAANIEKFLNSIKGKK